MQLHPASIGYQPNSMAMNAEAKKTHLELLSYIVINTSLRMGKPSILTFDGLGTDAVI